MKMSMKLTTGILAIAITTAMGAALSAKAAAQSTDEIDNARSMAKSLQQKQANDTNAALDAAGVTAPAKPAPAKPAPGAPAPAIKPAAIPGAKPAPVAAAVTQKSIPAQAAKAASASTAHNQLQKVHVVSGADTIQIEISSSQPVTPKVSKLASPARILVELPETADASAQSKIPVGAGGVRGVRIGMDGKTPPTTSVVIDLDKALAYELTPGPEGKAILTLHTQGGSEAASTASAKPVAKAAIASAAKTTTKTTAQSAAKTSPAPVKAAAARAAKVQTVGASKAAVAAAIVASTKAPATKPAAPDSKKDSKQQAKAGAPAKTAVIAAKTPDPMSAKLPKSEEKKADDKKAEEKKAEEKKPEDKKWAMSGKRDPFFSPVVQQGGSGCSTGKKCLEIGAINLRGVVKSDSGFIAVVTNNLNKAYFLRENDPVFNGYVVKITGDSVTFQETVQDKLGKTFTREVVKRIFTPAV
jgi:Tfp pilus assembly protein PilP